MKTAKSVGEIELVLRILDEAYEKKAWHGANLRGSVRGLTANEAAWRPRPDRHCIADIVTHAAYWKYVVRRRLQGGKRGEFPLTGSNWFRLPDPFSDTEWKRLLTLLAAEHRQLRAAVAALSVAQLQFTPPDSKVSNLTLITGIAAHDLYHTGQIQLLKRLQS